jgi:hypothetical protein
LHSKKVGCTFAAALEARRKTNLKMQLFGAVFKEIKSQAWRLNHPQHSIRKGWLTQKEQLGATIFDINGRRGSKPY